MARSGNNHKGGRPKGKKGIKTLEREIIAEAIRQRTLRNVDIIYDSQLTIAKGLTFLYKIEKEWIATGKGPKKGYWKNKKPELVESQAEIEAYLEERIENQGDMDDDQDSGATYYFLTTKEPNNMAIDSMLNRAIGKPKDTLEVQGGLDVTHRMKRLSDADLEKLAKNGK